jgi:hypothetical protein
MRQHQPVTAPEPVVEEPPAVAAAIEIEAAAAPEAPEVPEAPEAPEAIEAAASVAAVDDVEQPEGPAVPATAKPVPRPSPHHLAELSGAFAMTANVHDPELPEAPTSPAPRAAPVVPRDEDEHDEHHHHHHDAHHHHDEVVSERGLRGLVGGGASQVSVSAAMRARDAARPSAQDLAAAERDLPIVRRGWVPREELTRPGRRSPTG